PAARRSPPSSCLFAHPTHRLAIQGMPGPPPDRRRPPPATLLFRRLRRTPASRRTEDSIPKNLSRALPAERFLESDTPTGTQTRNARAGRTCFGSRQGNAATCRQTELQSEEHTSEL